MTIVDNFDRGPSPRYSLTFSRATEVRRIEQALEQALESGFAYDLRELILKLIMYTPLVAAIEHENLTQRGSAPSDTKATNAPPIKKSHKVTGSDLCKRMGGIVEGNVCRYIKYEVTAGGVPMKWARSTTLQNIDQEFVRAQYIPSQEAYNSAVLQHGEPKL